MKSLLHIYIENGKQKLKQTIDNIFLAKWWLFIDSFVVKRNQSFSENRRCQWWMESENKKRKIDFKNRWYLLMLLLLQESQYYCIHSTMNFQWIQLISGRLLKVDLSNNNNNNNQCNGWINKINGTLHKLK